MWRAYTGVQGRQVRNPKTLAAITVGLWSFTGVVGSQIAFRSGYLLLVLSFSFTLLTFYLFFSRGRTRGARLRDLANRPQYFAFGLFGYFIYYVGRVQSYRAFQTASEATLLNYTWPLFTIVFAQVLFSRQKRDGAVRWIEGLGMVFGVASVFLVATQGQLSSLRLANGPGVAWGLLAGISYGFYSAYSATVPEEEQAHFLLASIAGSWAFMLICAVSEAFSVRTLTPRDVLLAVFLGCLADGLGYIAWTRANRLAHEMGLRVSAIASMTLALPLFNAFWISVLLRETALLSPGFLLSLGLIVASSVLCQRAEQIANRLG